jgi:hypothetical protein
VPRGCLRAIRTLFVELPNALNPLQGHGFKARRSGWVLELSNPAFGLA